MSTKRSAKHGIRPSKATLPRFISPQLAELVTTPPSGAGWVHELKYDGFRMHLRLDGSRIQFLTRTGLDWTENYEPVAKAARRIKAKAAYIDGEMCAVLPDGSTSFPELQAGTGKLVYFAFDLLHLDGLDLTTLPLTDRKARLRELLDGTPNEIRYSEDFNTDGKAFLEAACRLQAEGMISKRVDAPYSPDNRGIWQKVKCYKREEFVIVGYTDPDNHRSGISSLLLGYYRDGVLIYAGRGGGGMSEKQSAEVARRLKPLVVDRMPVDKPPPKTSRFGSPLKLASVHWVRPELVAEIRYLSWTTDGYLRHPTFLGLRPDKKAKDVRRDERIATATNQAEFAASRRASAERNTTRTQRKVSAQNIQRELPDAAVPPKDLLKRYWKKVGRKALKYLANRPLTLVRHVGGKTFFHKGPLPPVTEGVRQMAITKSDNTAGVRVWVDSIEGLLGLVDMDVVEIHPWQSKVTDIEHADLIVFDLDPGDNVPWNFVCETALALRSELNRDGLKPWVKTSGGKGLHIMVPLPAPWPWAEVRSWSKAYAERFAKRDERYITSNSPSARRGKLFLDYLRNGRGNTTVGTFSPRAREGWPVSYPIGWPEVKRGAKRADSYSLEGLVGD